MTRARSGWWLVGAGIGLALLFNLLGGLSAMVGSPAAGANARYESLTLPRLQPPGALFGIAWTLLYSLLGFAAARLWFTPASPSRTLALRLFALQLAANLAWAPLFFGAQQVVPALGLLGFILVCATATTLAAGRADRLAAWLMLPYLFWLGFAFALNARIWALNP